MPKFDLNWHEQGLKNSELSLIRYEKEIADIQGRADRLQNGIIFMRAQLEEAKRRGLDSYDPERFMVKRKPSSNT